MGVWFMLKVLIYIIKFRGRYYVYFIDYCIEVQGGQDIYLKLYSL